LEEFTNISVIDEEDDPLFRQFKPAKVYCFNDLLIILEKGKKGIKFPSHLMYLEKIKDSRFNIFNFT
jgi:hypothetical protein